MANTSVYTGADGSLTLSTPQSPEGEAAQAVIDENELVSVGRVQNVQVVVESAIRAFHEIGQRYATQLRPGNVTVSGTIKQFQWTNPHAYIQLVAKDSSGRDVEWSMEMGAPMYLYARGWRPSTLKAGQRVTITINPLRNGRPGGVVRDVTGADGKAIGTNR